MIQRNFSLILISFIVASSVFAAEPVGTFMSVLGTIKVVQGGTENKAKVNVAVYEGDVIKSSADSRATIVMKDTNILRVSPNTELQITVYKNDKKVELKLDKGKVRNAVNVSYDGKENTFLIKTPTAVAGVRGTDFVTSYDTKTQVTQVTTLEGKVELTNLQIPDSTVVIQKGEASQASSNKAPEAPKALPPAEIKKIDQDTRPELPKAPAAGTDTKNTGATGEPKKENAPRIEDRQDQTPNTFDKNVDNRKLPPAISQPNPNIQQPTPPKAADPVQGVIRNNNDKTKVIIDAK